MPMKWLLGKARAMMMVEAPCSATDVGDLTAAKQLLDNAFERGQPGGNQVGAIAGSEEFLGAAKEAFVMLVPADTGAGLERIGDLRLVDIGRGDQLEAGAT